MYNYSKIRTVKIFYCLVILNALCNRELQCIYHMYRIKALFNHQICALPSKLVYVGQEFQCKTAKKDSEL